MPAAELQHSSSATDNTFSLLGEAHPQPEDIPEAIEALNPTPKLCPCISPTKQSLEQLQKIPLPENKHDLYSKDSCSAKVEWAVCVKIFPWADTHPKRCTGPTHKHRSNSCKKPNFCTASAIRIIPIHELGYIDEKPYFTMTVIEGRTQGNHQ